MSTVVVVEDEVYDENFGSWWWIFLITGTLWLILSLIMFRFNLASAKSIGVLAGIVFLIAGAFEFALVAVVRSGWWKALNAILGVTRPGDWGADIVVVKYDSIGDLQWVRQLGSSQTDGARGVATDTNDNVYAAGRTGGALDGSNAGGMDVVLVKYDVDGNLQWIRQFGSAAADEAQCIATDSDDNIYVADSRNDRIQKFDSEGRFLTAWGESGGGVSQFSLAHDVAIGPDGRIYVTDAGNDRVVVYRSQ